MNKKLIFVLSFFTGVALLIAFLFIKQVYDLKTREDIDSCEMKELEQTILGHDQAVESVSCYIEEKRP
jgi:capsular polysaccharide biosynthesis protein